MVFSLFTELCFHYPIIFWNIGLMLKLKLQYFGHLMWRTDSLEKTLMLGKDWRQEEKGMTEDEMAGWHHRLDGREFEQALGVGDRQGSLACCSPWGCKESDTTEWLNWFWYHPQQKIASPLAVTIYLFPIPSLLRKSLICINTHGHLWEWCLREDTRPKWVMCCAIQLFVTKRVVSHWMIST